MTPYGAFPGPKQILSYRSQQMARSNSLTHHQVKYPIPYPRIHSVSSPSMWILWANKPSITLSKAWLVCGIWRVGVSLGGMRAMRGQGLIQSNQVSWQPTICVGTAIFTFSATWIRAFIPAWSVSLHPKGGTYAATGGTGNITIHSAESSSFGERKSTLSSGRNKFGMFCKHVGHPGYL